MKSRGDFRLREEFISYFPVLLLFLQLSCDCKGHSSLFSYIFQYQFLIPNTGLLHMSTELEFLIRYFFPNSCHFGFHVGSRLLTHRSFKGFQWIERETGKFYLAMFYIFHCLLFSLFMTCYRRACYHLSITLLSLHKFFY